LCHKKKYYKNFNKTNKTIISVTINQMVII
jgi:hypothetical protein